ncbi:4-hydroxyphenylpyruvate dioxygenase [Microvirga guangxiensis]|uniref:4-hydroxyphenylpyruvate dioxygenase n=1 Tax=Microvirga guangxiensis TaxID=549386 RepID=A0A1G5BHC5_9HYPH|nr:4-hydroxyphenylpyruvate dioxygenase [Microvirga guangxiensis]SCX89499.1 4-hydroxyphenylpyruvate dioxygenase [Microvirga guangxiensis]
MGPFPHDAPPPAISEENPMGTDGFEFVEFCHPDPQELDKLFKTMGFSVVAKHRSKNVLLYRQGDINFIVNAEPGSFAERFASQHGPSAPAMAFRVVDAKYAYERALSMGAKPAQTQVGPNELEIPAIEGIGGLQIYFVDRYGAKGSIYDVDFEWLGEKDPKPQGVGLYYIDHLTHNVYRGRLNEWAGFYERLFNFRQIRYFDIEGKLTGLHSRAMTSPDGKIRIPINEDAGETGQIEEYLQEYKGEGIQHVALGSHDLYESIESLIGHGLEFMPAPNEIYYSRIDKRLPNHEEPLERLQKNGILIDGEGVVEGGFTKVLLQRFGKTAIGPIFFEFIQRKGDEGFGEGNFKALFESIEEDQIRRGVLKPKVA